MMNLPHSTAVVRSTRERLYRNLAVGLGKRALKDAAVSMQADEFRPRPLHRRPCLRGRFPSRLKSLSASAGGVMSAAPAVGGGDAMLAACEERTSGSCEIVQKEILPVFRLD